MAKAAASRHLQEFKPESIRGTAGFTRVGQTRSGQWWLLDARGRPFLSRGVNGVNRTGQPNGRAGLYTATVDRLNGQRAARGRS